jgi:predicted phage baseplate assembly protein
VAAADRGEPPAADDPYLVTLFGVQTLTALHFRDDPSAVLQTLQARFDELLRTKLGRVADLARRARSGYILQTDDEGWEIGQAWGAGEGAALDPDRAEYRGPAAHAIRSNPREALPVVAIEPADASGPPWLPRPDLIDSGPTDRDVVGEVDDDGFLVLRFGDGRAGAVPEPGSRLNIRCRVGNGSPGNVGPGAINTIVFCTTKGSTVTAVRNPLPAAGGTDPESLEEVRQRAPGESRQRLMRAITAADYAALSEEIEGVQRAAADLRWTGSWYEARVALDVQGGGAAPGWLIGDEFDALHRYRRIGHDVSVLSSTLVPLRLKVCVQVKPEYIAGHVRGAVLQALGSRDLPDGRRGLFHPDNLTFGTPVRVSSVIAAVAAVPGVLNAVVTGLQRLFAQPDNALETGVLVLRTDEVAQLDNDPSLPENGVIDLTMGGGR